MTLPLSLYVHTPWCVRKCPYCDFHSAAAGESIPEHRYVRALIRDLDGDLRQIERRSLRSIYIGGGTPSLFSPDAIGWLLNEIRDRLDFDPEVEVTIEANPGVSDRQKFSEYREAGINRLSIGIQSFQPDLLERLGRIHSRREAISSVEDVHAAGFENFNLDIIFGLPQQNLDQAIRDITLAIDLESPHISYYQLTIEPGTAFYRDPPILPPEDLVCEIQEEGQKKLALRGFRHYEVSAYARAGRESRHNLNYWQFGDYLGIGAGAHGKMTAPDFHRVTRRWKIKEPEAYMAQANSGGRIEGECFLSAEDLGLEFMMNALRLIGGFPEFLFTERTGLSIGTVEKQLREAEEKGFIAWSGPTIRPTDLGQRFLNQLLELFVP